MSLNYLVNPGYGLKGEIRVPGDKSISHRSIIIGALAEGITEVVNLLEGEDVLSTVKAMRALGVRIEAPKEGFLQIYGVGFKGLQSPKAPLNLGNSGTSMRLLSGVLAGQNFDSRLLGDDSLMARPMERIIHPLNLMGASLRGENGDYPPIVITGNQTLTGIQYDMPVASAQVKSALLLAGLFIDGEVTVREPGPTRDHTERMLEGFGYSLSRESNKISLSGGGTLVGRPIEVPADLSSAAFFLVGAAITPNSDILLKHVGINPTRTGILKILELMGADFQILNQREVSGEPVADIRIRYSKLRGIEIPSDLVPLAIDEFPVIFIAAACAEGNTKLSGAAELKVKESDRITSMAIGLDILGVKNKVTDDGLVISGGVIKGGKVNSFDDHRIAMAFAIAGLAATNPIEISNCENIATSFPNFFEVAQNIGMDIVMKVHSPAV
tara:strand:- start:417 stop:1739 length:1323 start_codon:yes stop_codon:yes gene_type:complete